ncbi:hypothetical protein Tco_0344884 [Tanacetum coccineum]
MPLEDDVFPNEEQPLPAAVSPTVDSPGYITKSDPKEDPKEEEDDEDLERNLDIYLMTNEIGYEITKFWEDPDEIAEEILATDVAALGKRITDFVTTVRQDTDEIYRRLDYAQDDRLVMSGQLNLLRRDKCSYGRTARLMEGEARAAQEAWAQATDSTEDIGNHMVATTELAGPSRDPIHHDVSEEAGRVADVLVERDAAKSRNGKDSHDSGTCVRRTERAAREYTYPDFMKCQPLNFKGTKDCPSCTQDVPEETDNIESKSVVFLTWITEV